MDPSSHPSAPSPQSPQPPKRKDPTQSSQNPSPQPASDAIHPTEPAAVSSRTPRDAADSSWQAGRDWYDEIVGNEGHYDHQQVILPRLLPLLQLPSQADFSLADLGCGQGILERSLPESIAYWGLDLSSGLIERARDRAAHPERCHFVHGDASQPSPLPASSFDRVVVLLALQNMPSPGGCLQQIARLLKPDGFAVIVLNHPAFRIPTQSDWFTHPHKNVRSRTIDRYMSPLKIPMKLHPSQGENSPIAWSFHLPLSRWTDLAAQAGLGIVRIEEWCSNRKSEGPLASVEDRARQEIPLFAALVLRRWPDSATG